MQLDQVHNGKVFQHLKHMLGEVKAALNGGEARLERALMRLNHDPVYMSIAANEFRSPTSDNPSAASLQRLILSIAERAGRHENDLKPFLSNIGRFASGGGKEWNEYSYFIIPIITEMDGAKRPGMVYLRSKPIMKIDGRSNAHLHIEDLTRDPVLLNWALDYFGMIINRLMETLYFVQTYPFDPSDHLMAHAYRLYFGSQITEGKSMGAATLAMFAIGYLQSIFGEQVKGIIAPKCGTLITGEIGEDGSIIPVENLVEKVSCAVDEYGPGLKVIVPADERERLPETLLRRIDYGNVHPVSNIEELLAAALSSDQFRGLNQARSALFKKLDSQTRDKLRAFVCKDVGSNVYELFIAGHNEWITPEHHEGGVYAICRAGHKRLDLRLGLESSGLQASSLVNHDRELVEIILDGSEAMGDYWGTDGKNKYCKMTSVLYEIAKRIDSVKQELVCGFLGHSDFYQIDTAAPSSEMDYLIRFVREKHKLEYHGPFFRPVYETSLREYRQRLKRVYIVSDSHIPDFEDLTDLNISSCTLLRLNPLQVGNDDFHNDDDEVRDTVLLEDMTINAETLDRYFHIEQGTIRKVEVHLGEELPIAWTPRSGVLFNTDEGFVFCLEDINELRTEIGFQMANRYPLKILVKGELMRGQGCVEFQFTKHPTLDALKPLNTNQRGTLEGEEASLWQTICSPDKVCPRCSESRVHLLHESETGLRPQIIFPSLSHLKQGLVLLLGGSNEWHYFQTGYQIDGASFVLIEGRLHWAQARGYIEEVTQEDGLYSLITDAFSFYLCRV